MSLSEKLNNLLRKFGPPLKVKNTVNLIVNKDIKNYSDLKKEYDTLDKSWEYMNIYAIRNILEKEYFEPEQDNTPVRPPRYYYISKRIDKGPFTDPLGNKSTRREPMTFYKYKDMHKNGKTVEQHNKIPKLDNTYYQKYPEIIELIDDMNNRGFDLDTYSEYDNKLNLYFD